jgi:hypothetical protein
VSIPPVLDALPVQLRLVQRAATGTVVLGATLAAQAPVGMNGTRGYQNGRYEAALSEQGEATITLPNAAGADGKLHRQRFDCLTDDMYELGDEWIEIWHGVAGRGRLLFVGTPADWRVNRTTVTLILTDGAGLLELQRETAAGFWVHAPRDVFEHYTHGWVALLADDFPNGVDATQWAVNDSTTPTPGVVRLGPMALGLGTKYIEASGGLVNLFTERHWRLELGYDRSLLGDAFLTLAMTHTGAGGSFISMDVSATRIQINIQNSVGTLETQTINAVQGASKRGAKAAIEVRDRWALFYVDGKLAMSMEYDMAEPGDDYWVRVMLNNGTGATSGSFVDLDQVLLRRADPYLMRGTVALGGTDDGELRLPGTRPSGGLWGAYFDDADLRQLAGSIVSYHRRLLAPTRVPYAKRQDAQVNFAVATPPAWQAPGPPNGEYFSVRWTGAIFLDLAVNDVFMRLANVDLSARLWVGRTTVDRPACGVWASGGAPPTTITSGSMRTHMGASLSGWYPIRLEYANTSSGGGLALQWATTSGGTYTAVPATMLSPYGIYESDVRYDSHAEQLKALVSAFGLQYRCEPRSLESGRFPGEVVPRIRVGRDTDKVLTPSEATEVELSGSARDTVQTLLADAAGLADPSSAAQLTSEAIQFSAIRPAAVADRHMMVMSGYESLSDITDPALLATRLAAMLGLRLSPWEEIAARPRGARELRDTFPLTGAMALFAWEPGDGVRIVDDQIGFADMSPRQIIAPAWPFVPDGLGAPSVRFRQRPRSQQDALRELVRAVLLPQRNYQGQLVVVTGTMISIAAPGPGFSSAPLPMDIADVVKATLVVGYKTDTSTWTASIHTGASSILSFNTAGRYDVTPFIKARTDSVGGAGREVAVGMTGGTGTSQGWAELLVRV